MKSLVKLGAFESVLGLALVLLLAPVGVIAYAASDTPSATKKAHEESKKAVEKIGGHTARSIEKKTEALLANPEAHGMLKGEKNKARREAMAHHLAVVGAAIEAKNAGHSSAAELKEMRNKSAREINRLSAEREAEKQPAVVEKAAPKQPTRRPRR